ncbi:pyridoxamine 5'-phosphate oxidase [Alphaproteobacteria bacterium GH1-50]|uniref:Pyridoxamine 5'-phosphate oxidase n=1 Tax=Kangsaoukella pontilimi TaxID=2691042 RepID=A0A7C9MPV5_9RHOB|nr:pyridoxamine 5'-phosphate oxidase family protein [Kangsaoukella pontilimi]MXQ06797.1 pyridoxamine 5'-phosphate oxidase [Kangsaoukella pontilimi]
MNDDFGTLDGTLDAVWSRLSNGVTNADAPARTLALATDGPAVRMVVLRGADRASGTLTIWTNRASDKVSQLAGDPRAEALIWDSAADFQIRLALEVSIARGDAGTWDALGPGSRVNYARVPPPGARLAEPDAVQVQPDPAMFAVLTGRIMRIETLHLTRERQARARFPHGRLDAAHWIAP